MEACRLIGVKIHDARNIGLDYLEVLKKDTEQRVKKNVINTEHQHASKTGCSLPNKTFTKIADGKNQLRKDKEDDKEDAIDEEDAIDD